MLRFFSSLQLSLGLLLLLAVLAIGGTFKPAQPGHYEIFYQSIWFRALLGLLALNLLCCTLKNLPQKWQSRTRLFADLDSQQALDDTLLLPVEFSQLKSRLQAAGFRLYEQDQLLLAEKQSCGRWGVVLVHLAVLLVMLGAIWGETGFVGTLNTYLQQPNQRYFDWNAQRELDLGFSFRVDRFQPRYYPIQLRFELTDAASGRRIGQLMHYDNEAFSVPGTDFRVQLGGFDPNARRLTMDVYHAGNLLGQYLIGEQFEQFGLQPNPGFRMLNVEFRDPLLKQTETAVSVLENGNLMQQGLIRVNEPLTYRGVSFYQIAHNRDEQGRWSVGFQLSKDPGEVLVWAACGLLMIGFGMVFLLRHRALGIKLGGAQLCLVPLKGWRGELGERQWRELKRQLAEE